MRPRSLLALFAILVAAPALAGCADDVLPAEGIAKAPDATAAKGGARVSLRATFAPPGAGSISMRGTGVIDQRKRAGRLTLRVSDAPGLPAGLDRDALTQEVIVDRFTIYMRSPLFADVLPGGAQWLKLDLAKLGRAAGFDMSVLTQAGQDPTRSVEMLKAVAGEVKKVGAEEVRGVGTTHYRATVDLRKYPSLAPSRSRGTARAAVDNIVRLLGTHELPVDVWVDRDNVLRRFRQKLALELDGQRMPFSQTFELYDFGTKVDVSPPPAGQVEDVTGLAARGVSGSSG